MSMLLGYAELQPLIPECPPLLMVDRLELDLEAGRAVGVKNVSMDEGFFPGHFPGIPIMPGVLQVSAMAQAAGALLHHEAGGPAGRIPWIKRIGRIKFRNPVYPGDNLVVRTEITGRTDDGDVCIRGTALVGDTVASQGSLVLSLADPEFLVSARNSLSAMTFQPPEDDVGDTLDVNEIMRVIPHRFPFLLVDRILYAQRGGGRIVGLKNVTGNEPFFAGSAVPAYPGYLQVESAAQVGCTLMLRLPECRDKVGIFMAIDNARFIQPVVPGDQLVLDLTVVAPRFRFGRADVTGYVGDDVVLEAALKFAIVDKE